jgi:hypothetical protein
MKPIKTKQLGEVWIANHGETSAMSTSSDGWRNPRILKRRHILVKINLLLAKQKIQSAKK